MNDFFRSWGLLIVAVGLGILAFFFTNIYLSNKEQNLRDTILGGKAAETDVVVATVDIAPGTIIDNQNMAIATVETAHLSSSAVKPSEFSNIEGQVLKVAMSRGEPLLSHAVDGDAIERFSDLIEEGDRGVTIEVNSITSNSGLLVVGDYVDIAVSGQFRKPNSTESEEAYVPLFQKIKVLAIDRNPLLSKDQDFRYDLVDGQDENSNRINYDTVTLSLDGEDSNLLAFASEVGDIVFFLRNSKDDGLTAPEIVTTASITLGDNNVGSGLVGSYLYLSTRSSDQEVKTLLTMTDAVVNEELRSGSYKKSVPITQLTASAKDFERPDVGALLSIPKTTNSTDNGQDNDSNAPETSVVEDNAE